MVHPKRPLSLRPNILGIQKSLETRGPPSLFQNTAFPSSKHLRRPNILGDQGTIMPVPRDRFAFVQKSQATEDPRILGDHPKRPTSLRPNISGVRTS